MNHLFDLRCIIAVAITIGPYLALTAQTTPKSPDQTEVQVETLKWTLDSCKQYTELLSPINSSPGLAVNRLTSKRGTKIVVVQISWSTTPKTSPSGIVTINNLSCFAVHGADAPLSGIAVAIEPATDMGMWFIPEAGEGKKFAFDVTKWPKKTVSIAFIVPESWETIDVRLGDFKIGTVKTPSQ